MTASNSDTNDDNSSENIDQFISRTQAGLPTRQNWPATKSRHAAPSSVAAMIDHTLLKPEAHRGDVRRACTEAITHGFATVCLNSTWISAAAELLKGSSVLPIAVVGFPLGASPSSTKTFEARQAISDGDLAAVFRDIQAVVDASAPYPVKVIIETSLLTQTEKIQACLLSQAAGAAFVKTSTGFSTGGAIAADIALMRKVVGPDMGVKASGGVRTLDDVQRMVQAGANRIGTSNGVAIVTGRKEARPGY
jgi:deoxyribose-phosphate aldolase